MFHVKRSREGEMFHVKQEEGGVPVFGGGLPSLPPAAPAFSLPFCPHPPDPRLQSALPGGMGEIFCFILPGAGAPGTPAAKPGRRWLAGRLRPAHPCYRSRAALVMPSERKLINFIKAPSYQKCPCQCIFMKVLGGSGDSFKSPPTSPSPKKSG